MFDSDSVAGVFSGSAGRLQLHFDDGLILGPGDELVLPNSIEIVLHGSTVPEPGAMMLAALGALAVAASAARRRGCNGRH